MASNSAQKLWRKYDSILPPFLIIVYIFYLGHLGQNVEKNNKHKNWFFSLCMQAFIQTNQFSQTCFFT